MSGAVHSFTYSLNKCLLHYYTAAGTAHSRHGIDKTDKNPCLLRAYFLIEAWKEMGQCAK